PSAVVLIDSVILPHPAFVEGLQPFARALYGEGYREALHQTVSSLFLATDNPERKSRLLSAMDAVPQHVLASSFRITLRITMRRWLRADANYRWRILRLHANWQTSIVS
ncbi:MAG TPA: hypothetical protein VHP35_12480, partial [Terriglobia bacterium]|nr:hypothetical protein [Terriglobia bacterium]